MPKLGYEPALAVSHAWTAGVSVAATPVGPGPIGRALFPMTEITLAVFWSVAATLPVPEAVTSPVKAVIPPPPPTASILVSGPAGSVTVIVAPVEVNSWIPRAKGTNSPCRAANACQGGSSEVRLHSPDGAR